VERSGAAVKGGYAVAPEPFARYRDQRPRRRPVQWLATTGPPPAALSNLLLRTKVPRRVRSHPWVEPESGNGNRAGCCCGRRVVRRL